jgi:hypothetical protein
MTRGEAGIINVTMLDYKERKLISEKTYKEIVKKLGINKYPTISKSNTVHSKSASQAQLNESLCRN